MYKKIFTTFLAFTLAVSLCPSAALAAAADEEGIAPGTPEQLTGNTSLTGSGVEQTSLVANEQSARSEEEPAVLSVAEAAQAQTPADAQGMAAEAESVDEDASAGEQAPQAATELTVALNAEAVVNGGVYELVPAGDASVAASIANNATSNGDNAFLSTYSSFATQKFLVSLESDGYYSITSVESSQALDVVASGTASGTNVTQWPYYGNNNQLWALSVNADGSYTIQSKCNGLYLSAGFNGGDTNNICVAAQGDASVQSWKLVSSQTLSDAAYYVGAANNEAQVLDVSGGSFDNGGNVTLWDKTSVLWQRWELTYLHNGYYTLTSLNSGQALDVVASGTAPGTNVTQWPSYGAINQQWDVVDLGDGSYKLVSRCNGLELRAGAAQAGSNVVVGEGDVTTWRLSNANSPAFSRTIGNGVYEIANLANTNECLDVVAGSYDNGANITLWNYYGAERQHYRVTYEGDGWYSIKAMHSGQSLDIVASSCWPGANVTQWPYYGNSNQLWGIIENGDGSYSLYSKVSGLVLGCNGSAVDGSNVEMQSPSNANTQKWVFNRRASEASIDDGVYMLANFTNQDLVCDVVAGSSDDGANITLWNKTNPTWQRFRITNEGDGYYRIAPLHSGQAMDVVASGTAPGTNVTQWSYYGNNNQLWKIMVNEDDSYQFISKCNNLALDVDGDLTASANVMVSTPDTNRAQQKWALIKCSTKDSFKIYLDAGHGWNSSVQGQYDPGAQALGYVENNLTNEIVSKVASICQEKYGLCVYANTTGGNYHYRHAEAVKLSCSTFLSFHFNSGGGVGVESYIHTYNAAPGSAAWQNIIHSYLVAGTGLINRGKKQAAFAVCGGQLPSVLMELGFIDSATDMSTYRARFSTVAAFIAAGINEAASNSECQI